MIPEVGMLVKTDHQLTTSKGTKTRLPGIVGCNLFRLVTFKLFEVLTQKEGMNNIEVNLYRFLQRTYGTTF